MISSVFPSFIVTGVFGMCAFGAVYILTGRLFAKSHSPSRYYLLVLCLTITLIPLKIPYSKTVEKDVSDTQTVYLTPNEKAEAESTVHVQKSGNTSPNLHFFKTATNRIFEHLSNAFSYLEGFSTAYLCIAVILLLSRLMLYGTYCLKMRKSAVNTHIDASRYGVKNVCVMKSIHASSPILVYMEKPFIFLPSYQMTEDEIHTCLLHETTHIRQKDIIVRLLMLISSCLHFYNPMIFVVLRCISRECEICCDMGAVSSLNREKRKDYISNVLSLASNAVNSSSLTFRLDGSKKDLERRFDMILNGNNPSKRKTAVIAALCTFLVICIMLAGGVFAGRMTASEPEATSQTTQIPKDKPALSTALSDEAEIQDKPVLTAVTQIHPVLDSFDISHGYSENHKAVDYIAQTGANVYAGIDGTVTDTGYDPARGFYVDLTSTDGKTVLRYNHLSQVFVEKYGKAVAGSTIASVGQTGQATGPHLHFEVEINGYSANPEPLFTKEADISNDKTAK